MDPGTIIAPFLDRFLGFISRHKKYLFHSSNYVEDLKKGRENLIARKKDIHEKIENAERESRRPTYEVDLWQRQVDDILGKIETLLSDYENRACLCVVCSKYKAGYMCAKKQVQVDKLLELRFTDVDLVDCDHSNVPISTTYVVRDSLKVNLETALKYIEDVNSQAHVVGIWGPGGVGKTTLSKRIYNHCIKTSMFDNVIWIVASSEQSNIVKIQGEMVEFLKLNRSDDVRSQANIIRNFLINKNFLLLIDDLWERVNLNDVGVPNAYEEAECGKRRKVVFTTRSKEVCGNMEAKQIIEVKCLDPTQSWLLFKEKVGEIVVHDDQISIVAEDIARECKGLPLALEVIGRAMSTKQNLRDWQIALDQMKNSKVYDVQGMDTELLHVLKISYDFLASDQLRKCFLSISMWPEDARISEGELIQCWMGLDYIVDFESMDEAYQIGHSLIAKLQDACLLNFVDKFMVRMHDILRDLALWIASDSGENKNKWMVKAGIQLSEAPNIDVKWREAECISLMRNEITELPSDIADCPNLLTLILRGNNITSENYNFPSLKYLDLSGNNLHSIPEVICDLTRLQYLNLNDNNIENIPHKLRNLKELKYLLLRGNPIGILPTGVVSELGKLLVLNMLSGTPLSSISIEELKFVEKKLKYLGIAISSEEDLKKLMSLPSLRIGALCVSALHNESFHFITSIMSNPHTRNCLEELRICDSDSLFEIIFDNKESPQDPPSVNLKSLILSNHYKLRRIKWEGIQPKNIFAKLVNVSIFACNLVDDITWIIHLPCLELFVIGYCDSMKIAISNADNHTNNGDVDPNSLTFPSLNTLAFERLVNLEKISSCSLSFPKIRNLYVTSCHSLKTLPFEIKTTPKMERIIGKKEWWDKLDWKEDDNCRSHFNQFFQWR